jgi:hypothetical protein
VRDRRPNGLRRRAGLSVALGLALLLPAVFGLASAPARASPGPAAGSCTSPVSGNGLFANVTWNGVDVCTARDPSNALSIQFEVAANVLFAWSVSSPHGTGAATVLVSDARLQMMYIGFALSTRDVIRNGATATASGSVPLNWTPSALNYVIAGLYLVKASLLSNGAAIWNESFYVHATAPFAILAAFPLILVVLIIYELYAVARSGRQAPPAVTAPPPRSDPGSSATTETAPPSPPPTNPPPSGGTP